MFISLSIGCIWMAMSHTTPKIVLADEQPANEPIGTAQGIYPGRVVWVHDANATNENCTNTYTPVEDGWFLPKNNNQAVIDKMVSQMIRSLTGENSDEDAWDALFKNFNQTKGRGNAGYIPGQKIMIKANFTSTWGWGSAWPNINSTDYSIVKNQLVRHCRDIAAGGARFFKAISKRLRRAPAGYLRRRPAEAYL